MEQKGPILNQIQYIPIKVDQDEIDRLQQEGVQYSVVIINRKTKGKTVSRDFSLNPQGVLYKKIQVYRKEFTALMVSKPLQNYVLHERHTSLIHNTTTRLYLYLDIIGKVSKRQCRNL